MTRTGFVRQDHIDQALTVERTCGAQDRLVAGVVLGGVEDILVVAHRTTGQGARSRLHIGFGVRPHAEAEQLHQLARQVLIRTPAAIGSVVEIHQHRRIAHDAAQQGRIAAQSMFAQEAMLLDHGPRLRDFVAARDEPTVQEQRGLVTQRIGAGDHAPQPPMGQLDQLLAVQLARGVLFGAALFLSQLAHGTARWHPHAFEVRRLGLRTRREQALHAAGTPLLDRQADFGRRSAKTRAIQQVFRLVFRPDFIGAADKEQGCQVEVQHGRDRLVLSDSSIS